VRRKRSLDEDGDPERYGRRGKSKGKRRKSHEKSESKEDDEVNQFRFRGKNDFGLIKEVINMVDTLH